MKIFLNVTTCKAYQTIATESQNTINFDQNEGGGTINFLLIPE